MFVILLVIAASVTSTPIVMAVLVAAASRREDSQWTLAEPASGPLQAIARRIVGFHSKGIEWLQNCRGGHVRNRAQKPRGSVGAKSSTGAAEAHKVNTCSRPLPVRRVASRKFLYHIDPHRVFLVLGRCRSAGEA